MRQIFTGIILASIAATTFADQWMLATPETYASRNGEYRLTVFPRQLAGVLPYFEDKVAEKSQAGQRPGGLPTCEATLERLVGNSYEQLWRKPLVNDVSPVDALVSDFDGSFVTFDNWHSRGWGDDVIVAYSGAGDLVKKFALLDIMTEEQIQKLPRSSSSIWWGGKHQLDYEERVVELFVVTNGEWDEPKRKYQIVRMRLSDGSVIQ